MQTRIEVFLAALIFPFVVQAQTTFGSWTTGVIENSAGVYAATMNDSGAILGEYCYYATKTCQWIIAVDSTCVKEQEYPVLANTDKGAASFTLHCNGLQANGLYSFSFRDWKDLETMIRAGARLGIATPMQTDQFKVYRFLLNGLNASTQNIEGPFFAAVKATPAPPKRPTNSTATDVL